MDTDVRFQGPGPFSIAPAQSASAQALSASVEICLNAIVGSDANPRPIYVKMTHDVANKLGHDLVRAAVNVETKGPR